jgi:transposase
MELTDQQWSLIQPLLPKPQRTSRGRPPLDRRLILGGILWKLSTGSPWYDLPRFNSAPTNVLSINFPSWQTCYHYYRQWQRSGLIDEIHRLLYQDLHQRGGFDLYRAIQDGRLSLIPCGSGWIVKLPTELQDTWQRQTALLLVQYFIKKAKSKFVP